MSFARIAAEVGMSASGVRARCNALTTIPVADAAGLTSERLTV